MGLDTLCGPVLAAGEGSSAEGPRGPGAGPGSGQQGHVRHGLVMWLHSTSEPSVKLGAGGVSGHP